MSLFWMMVLVILWYAALRIAEKILSGDIAYTLMATFPLMFAAVFSAPVVDNIKEACYTEHSTKLVREGKLSWSSNITSGVPELTAVSGNKQ